MYKFVLVAALVFCASCGKKDDDNSKTTKSTADYSCLIGAGQASDTSLCADYSKVSSALKSQMERQCTAQSGTFSSAVCADIATGTKGCRKTEGTATTTIWLKGEAWRTDGVTASCTDGDTEVTK
jgi:hypothetical protein